MLTINKIKSKMFERTIVWVNDMLTIKRINYVNSFIYTLQNRRRILITNWIKIF